ncbi:protein of unknown function [Taphrina deformans PYCC 5710]|uniref:Vacuolar ATPase assembly protein VMA22 n=1 Tax=Taphrina deformans (strain PYCC 5710 / ATCC 11124 / CBS 356.35 / IMI 108563 / JCM 9778 / NBRC 8474) TaxID=1097556 RepID=R4X7I0_TAPDE|nr:protein of unknown function [Taphrina deformans PYCC 5710]|eukprot:CCG81345.1 protein of unknown function [Taphrina deformans PYCC 5710]
MDNSASYGEAIIAADVTILQHLQLLDRYSGLQQRLKAQAAEAFMKLSRAKYHGTQLASESFPEYFVAYLYVKPVVTPTPTQSPKSDNSATDNVIQHSSSTSEHQKPAGKVSDLQILTESLQKVDMNKKSASVIVEDTDKTEVTEELVQVAKWRLETLSDRKKNPLRTIEILPSQPLRQTQTAFHGFVQLSMELAAVRVQIRDTEVALQEMMQSKGNMRDNQTTRLEEKTEAEAETAT